MAVTAAPEKGKANRAVLEVLAAALEVSPSSLEILSGHTSRDKAVLVAGLSPSEMRKRLSEILSSRSSGRRE